MLNFNPKYSEYWTEYDNQQSTQTPVFGRMFMVTTLFLCVVDEHDILIGVLSEMDCLRAILSSVYNESPAVGEVSEFMTREVISVSLHDSIVDVANDMLKHKHRRKGVCLTRRPDRTLTCTSHCYTAKEVLRVLG